MEEATIVENSKGVDADAERDVNKTNSVQSRTTNSDRSRTKPTRSISVVRVQCCRLKVLVSDSREEPYVFFLSPGRRTLGIL